MDAAARRVRAIKAKATENFEERGLQTLFLAWGIATWANPRGATVPAAPVLLRQGQGPGKVDVTVGDQRGLPGRPRCVTGFRSAFRSPAGAG